MFKCPIRESSEFVCGDKAEYLVAGGAICEKHAMRLRLIMRLSSDAAAIMVPMALREWEVMKDVGRD